MTFPGPAFKPFPFCRNRHVMTIFPHLLPRSARALKATGSERLFSVAPNSQVLCQCNIRDKARPTLIVIHGLESNSSSSNVVGLAVKAWEAGFNVIRMNLRNCGNTMHLTDTLYNAGLSNDVIAIARELRAEDFGKIFLAGYSLGGNIILKAASELGADGPELFDGICGISPAVDLEAAVISMESGFNRIYDGRFLWSLKQKIERRSKLDPGKYPVEKLSGIGTLRSFDDVYTCKDAGYDSAKDYYAGASSLKHIDKIAVPTLIMAAQDDPIVPFSSFAQAKLQNSTITLIAPQYGGHGGFLAASDEPDGRGGKWDNFWGENRVVEYFLRLADAKNSKGCLNGQSVKKSD